ncbi:MAG: sodium/glutamate symporter [Bdellovibrionales bacterium]|nr:sodium/glutamate symporter [Bdellovibrionales bacterium]
MQLNALQTLAITAAVILFGRYLKNKWTLLDNYNLPTPVVGGLLFALVLYVAKITTGWTVTFDLVFREPLMIAFFASVGYSASVKALKAGGIPVIFFFGITVLALLLQTGLGIMAAQSFGYPPLLGVLTSAVSLTGGPGTALAFAPLFEVRGVEHAATVGLSSAMGGIIVGGLIGSPITTFLIRKHKLSATPDQNDEKLPHEDAREALSDLEDKPKFFTQNSLKHVIGMLIIMGLGAWISTAINTTGITLPIYIGSMISAALIRNLDDVTDWFDIEDSSIEDIGNVCLSLFIAMSIVTLDLSQLQNTAVAILIFLVLQSVLTGLLAYTLVFKAMGKDYDAAVISGGFTGFMMGTTANAMANMNAITEKYGPSNKAYLVVPLVGTCFIDFVNAALVTFCINFWG